MSREMNQIIFRESAGNDKLVQKTREPKRLSSIRFDVLRVHTSKPILFSGIHSYRSKNHRDLIKDMKC